MVLGARGKEVWVLLDEVVASEVAPERLLGELGMCEKLQRDVTVAIDKVNALKQHSSKKGHNGQQATQFFLGGGNAPKLHREICNHLFRSNCTTIEFADSFS